MKIQHERINTFAYLHSAADWALTQAESTREGSTYSSMHAILASVHCLEAFTNHVGPRFFGEKWDTKKAGLSSPKEKLRALLNKCHVSLGEIQPEYDSYILGLGIRKDLTHGRTHEIIKGAFRQEVVGSAVSASRPAWHSMCEPQTARRVFSAVTTLIERMAEPCGESKICLGVLGGASGWE